MRSIERRRLGGFRTYISAVKQTANRLEKRIPMQKALQTVSTKHLYLRNKHLHRPVRLRTMKLPQNMHWYREYHEAALRHEFFSKFISQFFSLTSFWDLPLRVFLERFAHEWGILELTEVALPLDTVCGHHFWTHVCITIMEPVSLPLSLSLSLSQILHKFMLSMLRL